MGGNGPNATMMAKTLDADEARPLNIIEGSAYTNVCVSESGLYKVILRAERTRPEVVKFQDWVTKEVLPSIRRTGAYVV